MEQYARFNLGMGRATGLIVGSTEGISIRVRVVNPVKSPITKYINPRKQGKTIKRHKDKHQVKISPPGVIPWTG